LHASSGGKGYHGKDHGVLNQVLARFLHHHGLKYAAATPQL
jgi:hypothetical protein